ncbi:MAG: alpha-E domain-containing protein, partial [Paracoccaceae bacterium]
HLDRVAKSYGRETVAQEKARTLRAEVENASVEAIFDEGLHEYLTRYIREAANLAHAVHDAYLSGEMR